MALKPYEPALYSLEDAAHLARRTSFGATAAEIRELQRLGPRDAVRKLLDYPAAELADNPFDPAEAAKNAGGVRLAQLRWLHELARSPYPLREKLTLFWSNHFVIGLDKVRHPGMIAQYLRVLRESGLGTFERLALEVARSPAMLRYLDNDRNKKGKPNENFARELLELFTVGIGQFTEADVRDAARAFTGWTYRGGRGAADPAAEPAFRLDGRAHDDGEKTVLGRTGRLGGEDVVSIAARHPATANFVCAKLWRAFINDTPDPAGQAGLAAVWRDGGGDLRRVLSELLASDAFYSLANRRSIHKSPIDFVIGSLRALGPSGPPDPRRYRALVDRLARMGQEPLYPPTVEGWKGGREWVNDTAILLRVQTAASLTLGGAAPPEANAEDLMLALVGGRVPYEAALEPLDARRRAYLVLISPEYALA